MWELGCLTRCTWFVGPWAPHMVVVLFRGLQQGRLCLSCLTTHHTSLHHKEPHTQIQWRTVWRRVPSVAAYARREGSRYWFLTGALTPTYTTFPSEAALTDPREARTMKEGRKGGKKPFHGSCASSQNGLTAFSAGGFFPVRFKPPPPVSQAEGGRLLDNGSRPPLHGRGHVTAECLC